jgi:hypothetical protein
MSALADEIEALSSIYDDELDVRHQEDGAVIITIVCEPQVDVCFVAATLKMTLPVGYPEEAAPAIDIPLSPGLDEMERRSVLSTLLKVAEEQPGEPVVFQLIEAAKEALESANNLSECQVCRCLLAEMPPVKIATTLSSPCTSPIVKTACRHNFHSACLARWWSKKVGMCLVAQQQQGGETEEAGREREAIAKKGLFEQALVDAKAEAEAAEGLLGGLKVKLAEAEQASLGADANSRSGATRADARRLEAEEAQLRSEVRLAEDRVAASNSGVERAQTKLEAALIALSSARAVASESVKLNGSKVVATIPCPNCRAKLQLPHMPFNSAAFVEKVQFEAAAELESSTSPEAGSSATPSSSSASASSQKRSEDQQRQPSMSCKAHLSGELLAMVKATQEKQRHLLQSRKAANGGPGNEGAAEER